MHPVGQKHRLGDVVGDEDDGLARLEPDFLDHQVHLLPGECVERAERLVHHQHRGVERQCADNRCALLHPARQLARILAAEAVEAHAQEQMVDPRLIGTGSLDLERKMDVLGQSPPRKEVGLLKHHADLRMRTVHARTVKPDLTASQAVQAGHRPEQGGLPATRGADDADELALVDPHRIAVQRVQRSGPGVVELGRTVHDELCRTVVPLGHFARSLSRNGSGGAPFFSPSPVRKAPTHAIFRLYRVHHGHKLAHTI